jgi:hypothetical protein
MRITGTADGFFQDTCRSLVKSGCRSGISGGLPWRAEAGNLDAEIKQTAALLMMWARRALTALP